VKNRMSDLRNHLFETLERLKDKDEPMDPDRAKAVSEVAQTVINSAKVELQFLDLTGRGREQVSEFLDAASKAVERDQPRLINGKRVV
jgi:hypothetical protein